MEYVQERITTLHALSDPLPRGPVDRTGVVVPMTERDHASLAAERVFGTLERVDPARVVVPLRASADRVAAVRSWLDGFDLTCEVLWCDGPALERLLSAHGLDGGRGKGRDVWLGLGLASAEPYVAAHDADARSYSAATLRRLVAPLADGFSFVKGYYARVEDRRLYGRLFRLFYVPLVRALAETHDAPVVDYLDAFRYALAGEFAATADLARRFRPQRGWGLEVGQLGDAFEHGGFAGTAQVDLGVYEHDHRAVGGPTGLSDMSHEVGAALFRVLEDHGVSPDYDALAGRYRTCADRLVDQYAADARFNDLEFDAADERAQVDAYADAVAPPGPDARLPPWTDAPIDPADVRAAAREDCEALSEGPGDVVAED